MTLTVGTKVICTYRSGSAVQPWLDNCWIGEIQQANTTRIRQGYKSDAEYCEAYGKSQVRYTSALERWGNRSEQPSFTQIDSNDSLIPVSDLVDAVLSFVGARR